MESSKDSNKEESTGRAKRKRENKAKYQRKRTLKEKISLSGWWSIDLTSFVPASMCNGDCLLLDDYTIQRESNMPPSVGHG
jgi:hypothetical protein